MDRDALAERLMTLFLQELDEHERTLEVDLLALERAPREQRAELVESLFRAAHSLKGAARAVQAPSIESVCHTLEQALTELRGRSDEVPPAKMELLLTYVDRVRAAAEALRERNLARSAAQPEPAPEPLPAAPRSKGAPAAGSSIPTDARVARGAAATVELRAARIDAQKIDALLASSRDLIVSGARAEARFEQFSALREEAQALARAPASSDANRAARLELESRLERAHADMRDELRAVTRASRHVDDQARRLRMVAFREACEGFDRTVRDLARTLGKPTRLEVTGAEVELDRDLVQRLRDPLLHLVRNAISHGVETPDARRAAGKPAEGVITIAARVRGSSIEVQVGDDGRGLDLQAVRQRARELGLPDAGDDEELSTYVFFPGLSTASTVDEIAGRGVGLDAVKRTMEALHGGVGVFSQPRVGTTFTFTLPLTLTKLRAILVEVAGRRYALPTAHVKRVLRFGAEQLIRVGVHELVRSESELVPLTHLASLLGLAELPEEGGQHRAQAVVVESLGRSVALTVAALREERELIVHNLPARVAAARYVSGAAPLPSGHVAPILHGTELAEAALANLPRGTSARIFADETQNKRRLLVVDDSITTRALIKSILEEAGYEVSSARDGAEAFRMLSEHPHELVVSDVQMPRMDGFALTQAIRRAPALSRIPVVLVTALETEADRRRGLDAGANAYLGKSAFDQRVLLDVVGGLL